MPFPIIIDARANRRRGLTLVELMVALAVISVLAGIALPAVKNALREQRVSRAASLVKAAIDEARARSIADGGGGGLIIDRVGSANLFQRCSAVRLRFASGQPEYRGQPGAERCVIGVQEGANLTDDLIFVWLDPDASYVVRSFLDIAAGNVPTLINLGDQLALGDAALPTVIRTMEEGTVAMRNSDRINAITIPDAELLPNVTGAAAGAASWIRIGVQRLEPNSELRRFVGREVSFAIRRSPRPAVAFPIEMPEGTAIDLTASGIGAFGNQFSPMWAGDGSADGNYLETTLPPFAIMPPPVAQPPIAGQLDYREIYILFGARGEVTKVLSARGNQNDPTLTELPVTGDIHLLVGRAGEVKTDPEEQLEDQDSNWVIDESDDGTTPLLNPESIWVTIKSRTGEVIASPWVNPTSDAVALIPPDPTGAPLTDADQQFRLQTVLSRVRSSATDSKDQGSL